MGEGRDFKNFWGNIIITLKPTIALSKNVDLKKQS